MDVEISHSDNKWINFSSTSGLPNTNIWSYIWLFNSGRRNNMESFTFSYNYYCRYIYGKEGQ